MNYAAKALLRHGGKYLVLKQAISSTGAFFWENPGGRVDHPESPECAVVREVFEETGISCTIDRVISEDQMNSGDSKWKRVLFLCDSPHDKVALSREHSDFRWLTLDELLVLEEGPRVQDDARAYADFLTKNP